MSNDLTRRGVLKTAFVTAAAGSLAGMALAADAKPKEGKGKNKKTDDQDLLKPSAPYKMPDKFRGLKVGCASYSLRQMPLEAAIKAMQKVGLAYVSIKEFHLPLKSTTEERKAAADKFREAGIEVLSCGNISLKNEEKSARNAFEYVRDVGAKVMVCAPDPDALPLLAKLAKEHDIKMAIHNHGPESPVFKSPYDVQAAIKDLDPIVGYCIDVGHTRRAGVDPAKAIRELHERVYDVHLKDIWDTEAKKNAGAVIEMGRGKLDIPAIMQALLDVKFTGHAGIEYEKDAPEPVPGLAECAGYVRGVMTGLK